jgi:signal transduction histidine kinase
MSCKRPRTVEGRMTVKTYDIGGLWLKGRYKPNLFIFPLLILAGLFLELVVHFGYGAPAAYTHFYYLIIIIAALWYGRKSLWIALFFGGLYIVVTYLDLGTISPDALFRAVMFCIVAFLVGTIIDTMDLYRNQLENQNRELLGINTRLDSSQKAFETANKKLHLLSSVTRQDIRNQLTGLLKFLELTKKKTTDPETLGYIDKEEAAAQNIQKQIEFTKNYEDIGVHAPRWQNIGIKVKALQPLSTGIQIGISPALDGMEALADPLLEKVFTHLIENSLRHGERVKHISLSTMQYGMGDIAIVYEDDGVGVHGIDKARIFEKGFGKHTGLGLFLASEILSITGITIKESGIYGKGARFEIIVPKGKYRSGNREQG